MKVEVVPTEQEAVDKIVIEWNDIVTHFENSTIAFCKKISKILKNYPDESVKGILKKVNKHPDIKKTISIHRIWQGLRLINKRPDLIEYMENDEYKDEAAEHELPYIKKDGNIFWEFYFELYKYNLNDGVRTILEQKGKREHWSYRDLKQEIRIARDEIELTTEEEKKEYKLLRRKAIAIITKFRLNELKFVVAYLEEVFQNAK